MAGISWPSDDVAIVLLPPRRSPDRDAAHGSAWRTGGGSLPSPPTLRGRRKPMAKFKVVTPAGANFGPTGGDYTYELEALGPIDAEIVEVNASSENEFISAANDADALYARGGRLTKRMIDGLD